MRRSGPITLVLSGALALGACGGDDEREANNAYARQVNLVQLEFQTSANQLQAAPSGQSGGQQRAMQRFEAAIDDVVDDLRAIDAPGDLSDEHTDLIGVMTRYGDEIGRAKEALRGGTPRTIERARERVLEAVQTANTQLSATIAAINAKLRAS